MTLRRNFPRRSITFESPAPVKHACQFGQGIETSPKIGCCFVPCRSNIAFKCPLKGFANFISLRGRVTVRARAYRILPRTTKLGYFLFFKKLDITFQIRFFWHFDATQAINLGGGDPALYDCIPAQDLLGVVCWCCARRNQLNSKRKTRSQGSYHAFMNKRQVWYQL